jgi:hypothetical protein
MTSKHRFKECRQSVLIDGVTVDRVKFSTRFVRLSPQGRLKWLMNHRNISHIETVNGVVTRQIRLVASEQFFHSISTPERCFKNRCWYRVRNRAQIELITSNKYNGFRLRNTTSMSCMNWHAETMLTEHPLNDSNWLSHGDGQDESNHPFASEGWF